MSVLSEVVRLSEASTLVSGKNLKLGLFIPDTDISIYLGQHSNDCRLDCVDVGSRLSMKLRSPG